MKNKIISIILFLVFIVSIAGNMYQFSISKDIEGNIGCYTTELSGLNDNIDSLNNDMADKDNELTLLSTKITELESSIQEVEEENENLSTQIEGIQGSYIFKRTVDEIIDSYPHEITAEMQAELDEYEGISKVVGLDDDYRMTVYLLFYGPTEEERDAMAAKAVQEVMDRYSQDSYEPATDTSMYIEPSSGEVKQFDPNHQVADHLKGEFMY